jgi:hypothetical protein
MSQPTTTLGDAQFYLPPLILHPFNERVQPSTLLDNSKAALMLSGLIPNDGSNPEALQKRLLWGRYAEIRMLFFLGKDVFRWMDQCVEWAASTAELAGAEVREQSFAGLLTGGTPAEVKQKLETWGVADYSSIFSRAIGLNSLFAEPPAFDALSEEFLANYHRFADALFQCFMEMEPHLIATPQNFRFDLYASGEYSRMLEREWESE